MILGVPAAAVVSTPATAQSDSARQLVYGAEHALRAGRLDQAKLMIARAMAAGAAGPELDRTLADFAYASGNYAEALGRYETILRSSPDSEAFFEPAGIAALRTGNIDRATVLLTRATEARNPSWRAWNALGVAADFKSDWLLADRCFTRAMELAPSEAAPINNRGWSLLSRGKWNDAVPILERAVEIDPHSSRAANNLELARAAVSANLPERQPGETSSAWSARLNDAGVAAEILGDRERAVAAFSRSLEASDTWYARAANNLAAVSGQ